MVDRVALLEVVIPRADLPAAQALQLNRQLDRALAIAVAELSLAEAQALPAGARAELESTLRDILTGADLRKVARRWEPQRRIDPDASQTEITDCLVELLHGRREPYVPCACTLAQARALPDRTGLRERIQRWAPAADLRRLAVRWDRGNAALAESGRAALAAGLVALLEGRAEPVAA